MPRRVMEHLSIPAHRLSATDTNIFGFNANSTRSMGKIKLRCQIGDLKTEVTVYVIDADTSYNLLLGRPWIHRNHIVPSTLHQVMKYVDDQGQVRTLVAEQRPFKWVENYFTDALLYQRTKKMCKSRRYWNSAMKPTKNPLPSRMKEVKSGSLISKLSTICK